MPRRITGFTPSGELHLGNYLAAIRPIIEQQTGTDTVVFISDLHALTLNHDPAEVRRRTQEFATLLLAAGVDPEACLFLVQSHVPEHSPKTPTTSARCCMPERSGRGSPPPTPCVVRRTPSACCPRNRSCGTRPSHRGASARDVADLAMRSNTRDPDVTRYNATTRKTCFSRLIYLVNTRTNQVVRKAVVRMIVSSRNNIITSYPGAHCK